MVANALAERWPDRLALHVQGVRLRRIIRHAFENVPFYREHFRRAGLRPEEIRTAEDLWRLPPVSKQDLKQAGDAAIDRRAPRAALLCESTSGTSGTSLHLVGLPAEVAGFGGYLASAWFAARLRPTDRILTVASRQVRWLPPPWHSTWLDRADPLEAWIEVVLKLRPTVVIGQTEGIVLIARELVRRQAAPRMRVRKVFPFGWTLPREFREVIRAGFGAEPTDCYGAMETIWIGRECDRHEGFHIPHHRLVAQCLLPGDPGRPAAAGEIVLTDLCRTTMPFIRYRIGDVGGVTETPCRCGRSGPRIMNLVGRVLDLLVTVDGRPMGIGWLQLYQKQLRGILKEFRFIQESLTESTLQWVPGHRWTQESMEEIRSTIRRVLGPLTLKEERYDALPADPAAKMRRAIRKFDIPEESLLNVRLDAP